MQAFFLLISIVNPGAHELPKVAMEHATGFHQNFNIWIGCCHTYMVSNNKIVVSSYGNWSVRIAYEFGLWWHLANCRICMNEPQTSHFCVPQWLNTWCKHVHSTWRKDSMTYLQHAEYILFASTISTNAGNSNISYRIYCHAVIMVKLIASAATKSMHPWGIFSAHTHTHTHTQTWQVTNYTSQTITSTVAPTSSGCQNELCGSVASVVFYQFIALRMNSETPHTFTCSWIVTVVDCRLWLVLDCVMASSFFCTKQQHTVGLEVDTG